MKQNHNYILTEISGVPYILPYGQQIADQRRGIKVNETGVFLWNLLETEHSFNEVLEKLQAHYEFTDAELTEASDDIKNFLNQLVCMDILLPDEISDKKSVKISEDYYTTLNIAGITIALFGNSKAFSNEFDKFKCDYTDIPDLKLVLTYSKGFRPYGNVGGNTLIHSDELIVSERENDYLLLFPSTPNIVEASINKEGTLGYIHYKPPFSEELTYDIFHAIRFIYLYKSQQKGLLALHSASILHNGKAWLFSGHSGMGKSTHTNLWNKLFNTPLINGDLNLLDCSLDTPVIRGIPWCGTSEICDNEVHPLGGIVLINRAPDNRVEELSDDKQILLVTQRLISPAWTLDMFNTNIELIEALSKKINIVRLHCTKDDEAAYTMKDHIDNLTQA